jgi:hypothetical protein
VWNAATNTCLKTLDTKAPGREEVVYVKGAVIALFQAVLSTSSQQMLSLLAAMA